MITRYKATKLRLLAMAALLVSNVVFAIDYSREAPPVAVPDAKVSVGNRAVKLPGGEWTYLSHFKGRVTQEGNAPIPWHSGYFAKLNADKFDLGVVLTLAEGNNQMPAWNDEPCKGEGSLLKSELKSSVLFPECILVNRRNAHLVGDVRPFLRPAKVWLETKLTEPIGPIYEIFYVQYSSTGFGRLLLFVPISKFQNEASVVAWAQTLPDRFRPLFENRTKEIELPPLPPLN